MDAAEVGAGVRNPSHPAAFGHPFLASGPFLKLRASRTHPMSFGLLLFGLSSLVGLAGWIWLIVEAFRNQEKNWGIALIVSLFLPVIGPILGIVFVILRWRIAQRPAYLLMASLVIGVLGFAITAMQARRAIAEMADLAESQVEIPARGSASPSPDSADDSGGEPSLPPRLRPSPPSIPPPPAPSPRKPDGPAEMAAAGRTSHSPPPTPARAVAEPEVKPATASALEPREPVVRLKVLRLGDPSPNQLRTLRIEARHPSPKSITELKLSLEYLDARGNRLGRWTTVHVASEPLRGSGATNEFDLQAFFVPQFTHDVRLKIESLGFADGSRWPVIP